MKSAITLAVCAFGLALWHQPARAQGQFDGQWTGKYECGPHANRPLPAFSWPVSIDIREGAISGEYAYQVRLANGGKAPATVSFNGTIDGTGDATVSAIARKADQTEDFHQTLVRSVATATEIRLAGPMLGQGDVRLRDCTLTLKLSAPVKQQVARTNPPPAPERQSAPAARSVGDIDPPAPYALTGNETPSDTAEAMRAAGLDGLFSTLCEKPLRFGNTAQVYSLDKMTLTGMGGDYNDGKETFRIFAAKYVSNQYGDDITIRFQNSDDTTLAPTTEVLQIIKSSDGNTFRVVWDATGKISDAPYVKHCSADVNPLVEPSPQQLQDAYAACIDSVKQQINQYRSFASRDYPQGWDSTTIALAQEAAKENADTELARGQVICKQNPYARAY